MAPETHSYFDESPLSAEERRPKPLPPGNYTCVVQSLRYDKSSKKGTDFVEFLLIPVETDANQQELEDVGGLEGKTLRATYYDTENSVYRLDEFHENCGIDMSIRMSSRLRNDECLNRDVTVVVKHEPAGDGSDIMYARVVRTLPPQ